MKNLPAGTFKKTLTWMRSRSSKFLSRIGVGVQNF